MQRKLHYAFCPLLARTLVLAGAPCLAWQPIPPEAWALRERYRDAVVMEKRTVFTNSVIETVCRIRVLSEAGRRSAEFPRFSPDCHHVEGRTVQSDGRVTELRGPGDFLPAPGRPGFVLPRNVTPDCIVEVRWQESTWRKYSAALPRRLGSLGEWELGGPFPTLTETLEVADGFKWRTHLAQGGFRPELAQAGGFRLITFKGIPAIEAPPFSLPPMVDRPRFQVFDLPKVLFERASRSIDAFWKAVMIVPIPRLITRDRIGSGSDRTMNTSRVSSDLDPSVKDRFQDFVHRGSACQALSRELLEGLPSPPQERARTLLARLVARIACDPGLTFDRDEREDTEEVDRVRTGPENLEDAARTRRTDARGMQVLLYQLLKDAGLKPDLALLADRRVRNFNYDAPIAWQFTDTLIGIEEAGRPTLWLDPTRKALPPGTIAPGLQGAEGLRVDTLTWGFRPFRMPFQPAAANARVYRYDLFPDASGTRYRLGVRLAGCAAYEANLAGRSADREEVGTLPASRTLAPFPGLPALLAPPGPLPAGRTIPIVLATNELLDASSTFQVPGRLEAPPAFQRANAFGSVAWVLTTREVAGGTQATVTFRVQVNAVLAPAQAYSELQAFLAWITEAQARTVSWIQP